MLSTKSISLRKDRIFFTFGVSNLYFELFVVELKINEPVFDMKWLDIIQNATTFLVIDSDTRI